MPTNLQLRPWSIFMCLSVLWSYAQATMPVAIPMTYHVSANKQKHIALAAYSSGITYKQATYGQNPIEWGVRYDDAITNWSIVQLPSHGSLFYENVEILSTPFNFNNPDELLYVPTVDFAGEDQMFFKVEDFNGSSIAAKVRFIVMQDLVIPKGIPEVFPLFYENATSNSDAVVGANDWYIDNSHPNATDTPLIGESHPRQGTVEFPRATLPPNNAVILGGSTVYIAGGYEIPYELRSGWHRWYMLGEDHNPVHVVGVNPWHEKPIITGADGDQLRLQMQYAVFEGLYFKGVQIYPRPGQSGGHIVFRHSVIDGMNRGTVGSGISQNIADYTVYYDLHIKHIGYTEPDLAEENDVHGIQVGKSHVFILDTIIHGCAGDAIQINAEFSEHIFIGRNKLHSDNENALDFKRRSDMIFVENDVWDYRAIAYQSSGSDGVPVIVNQDTNGQTPTRSTIARNRIWDANGAIRHQGNYIWTTDNVIWHIHHNSNSLQPSYAIVVGNNATDTYIDRISNNTFHHIDAGVYLSAGTMAGSPVFDHRYKGNNFGDLNDNSLEPYHFKVNSNHDQDTFIDYNNYKGVATFHWASFERDLEWMQSQTSNEQHSTENRDPIFNNPLVFDLSLNEASPLIDANIEHESYLEFYTHYGRPIHYDAQNAFRPNGLWDIGAYEFNDEVLSVQNDTLKDRVRIFPNPAKDVLTIQCDPVESPVVNNIQVYSQWGASITAVYTIEGSKIQVDITGLSSGVYFLRIEYADGRPSVVKKFVKHE